MRPRIAMKFGGTSVGTPEALRRTVAHIARCDPPPLVVVSAVGGVTDLLIRAAEAAAAGDDPADEVDEIDRRHGAITDALGLEPTRVEPQRGELSRLLQGIGMLRERSPRVHDLLVSLGERISARLVAAALRAAGAPAAALDSWELGLRTNGCHGRAEPIPGSHEAIRAHVARLPDDQVAVVTGFIAHSTEGEVTTLGRGGSDFSAALFGVACQVDEIQIWSDVPGILRADPRAVADAGVVPTLRFEEAAELAFFGARVLHPRTIEPARRAGIPVRVLGTFHVDPARGELPVAAQGTLIDDQAPVEPVRGMALHQHVQSLHIHSLRMLEAHGFLARVFEILARHQISVDVIATSEVSVSMTLDRAEGELPDAVEEISAFAEVELDPPRSLLCLVGPGLRDDTSLLARIFDVLAAEGVPVRMISQGASRINITLVTDPPHACRAMQALHAAFFATDRFRPPAPGESGAR